jgi:hypothetical protein
MTTNTHTDAAELTMQDVLDALPIDFEDVTFTRPDWVDLGDRKTLYRAVIAAMLDWAEDDGFVVVDASTGLPMLSSVVDVQDDPSAQQEDEPEPELEPKPDLANGPRVKAEIYGHVVDCILLAKHGMGTIDVQRVSDGRCFRVSGLWMAE